MKKRWILPLCALVLLCLFPVFALTERPWQNPFADVSEDMWYYEAVSGLGADGIIEDAERFYPESFETRGGIVNYLYKLFLSSDGDFSSDKELVFTDVTPTNKYYDAVRWAYESGVTNGMSPTLFGVDRNVSREEAATFLIRYADLFGAGLKKVAEPDQFKDSLDVRPFARSSVVVCKMAGVINGYGNGYFYPTRPIKKSEMASIVYKFKNTADTKGDSDSFIDTSANAFDSLYDSYISYFTPRVEKGPAVDLSYFKNCAFIGDSVTLSLKNYCAATGELGDATFICAGSLAARNALWALNAPNAVHPSYKGKKMLLEDAVAASGADKVYIMLGMNGIAFGVDAEIKNMVTLINKILSKSPNVKILIQSVTPMASSSNIKGKNLNNTTISQYNARLEQICNENKWYYLNVAEDVTGSDGNLIMEYCSDFGGMGIHFSKTGDKVWINYLRTHVPEELR